MLTCENEVLVAGIIPKEISVLPILPENMEKLLGDPVMRALEITFYTVYIQFLRTFLRPPLSMSFYSMLVDEFLEK